MSEVALLPNTDRPQQVEDYVRGCTTTKYWPTSTSWRLCQRLHYFTQILTDLNKLKIMSEVALLPNTDRLQQVEDYVRGCTTTKYWPTSTSWRLCQRLHYYQILTGLNKLKIMLEVELLLPNTDRLQQVEDYVRGCTTSTKYWPPSTGWRLCKRLHYYQILTYLNKLKIMSEVALLPNTDRPQQVEDYVRGCTTTKYWPTSTSWRLCQRLHYYQILTGLNKLKIMSEVALLPNTDRPQQVEYYVRGWTTSTKYWPTSTSWRLCQRLYYYQILTNLNNYVRGCTTSTKYWPTSTSWRLCQRLHYYQILTDFNKLKIMSEVALLPNTDRPQQVEDYVRGCTTTKYRLPSTGWRLCQRLYYYQILTAFNKLKIMSEVALLPNTDLPQQVEDYVRSCTTTKYWPTSTGWRLCQRLHYYQILTDLNKLKIMLEVALLPNTDRPQQVEDYVRGCTTTKYWPTSTSWRLCQRLHYYQILTDLNKLNIMSEVGLLLPNTDRPQQVEDYVRGCTTTKYWPTSTIMSEVALLLPNTDRPQQVEDYVRGCTTTKYWPTSTSWRLCQRLHYYQIPTAFNRLKIISEVALLPNTDRPQQVEDYVRGCTSTTKYWPPSTGWRLCQRLHYYQILADLNKLKIMSEVALLPNTDRPQQVEDYVRGCTTTKYWPTSTSWRLCQRLDYFNQILADLNKLKIMSEVRLLLPNTHRPQQVEDYVRGCTTTKYWPTSTSWRLCQRLHYFYQILTISTSWRLSQRQHMAIKKG